jgi:dynein heavy chain, axonemal
MNAALKAVNSIKGADIAELKQLKQAKDIIKVIFDTVQLLLMGPMNPVKYNEPNLAKKDRRFIMDSYDITSKLLTGPLLQTLLLFSKEEKDRINPETVELLDPYIIGLIDEEDGKTLFDPEVAKTTSAALWGLCTWARAMRDYHIQSKIVRPKMKLLDMRTIELAQAKRELGSAQSDLDEVNALKDALRKSFDEKLAAKQELETKAARTKKKMEQANRLINSLEDNKIRWIEKRNMFQQTKKELVGNVAKACAFVSYCGPFNAEFRRKLAEVSFQNDLIARSIPATEGL